MTLPTLPPARPGNLGATWQTVDAAVRAGHKIKNAVDEFILNMQSGQMPAGVLLDMVRRMSNQIANLTEMKAAPNLDNVAKRYIPGYTGTLTNDLQATINAMQACIAWVLGNVPKDGNGWVLVYKWNADGAVTERTFNVAQMAALVVLLNAVGATIG